MVKLRHGFGIEMSHHCLRVSLVLGWHGRQSGSFPEEETEAWKTANLRMDAESTLGLQVLRIPNLILFTHTHIIA